MSEVAEPRKLSRRGPVARPQYDAANRRYRLRKPGGGWWPLLSGVERTLQNDALAERLAQRYQRPTIETEPVYLGELIELYLRRKGYDEANCIHQWLTTAKGFLADLLLGEIDADILKRLKKRLQEAKYVRGGQKTAHKYSLVTIKKYVTHFRRCLEWGIKKGSVKEPEEGWTDPGLPTEDPAPRVPSLEVLKDAFQKLRHPVRATRQCPTCKGLFPKLGFHRHAKFCTSADYRPQIARERRVKEDKPHPAYHLCEFAANAGTRPDEACSLRFDQIDWALGICILEIEDHKTGQKTGERRTLYPSPRGIEVLRERQACRQPGQEFVFLNEHGRRYKPSGVYTALRAVGIRGLYALRHAFATYALLQGVPLEVIQKWLNHRSIVQTQNYAKLIDPQAILAARQLRAPTELAADVPVLQRKGLPADNGEPVPAREPVLRAIPAEPDTRRARRPTG